MHWADPGDAAGLARAIGEALADPQREQRLERARTFIEGHTWSAVARRHADAYTEFIEAAGT